MVDGRLDLERKKEGRKEEIEGAREREEGEGEREGGCCNVNYCGSLQQTGAWV